MGAFLSYPLFGEMSSTRIPASADPTQDAKRSEICAFVQKLGIVLKVPQITIASAIVFFHRFYCKYSFEEKNIESVAYACLFLASKVEESPIKLRDLIQIMYQEKKKMKVSVDSPEFNYWRKEILEKERNVLQTLGFDFQIEHPYSNMLAKVKQLQHEHQKRLAQFSWNFINDSLRTTLCIQYDPKDIASTSIYLASKYLQSSCSVKGGDWLDVLDCPMETIERISNQILDLYDQTTKQEEKTPGNANVKGNGQPTAKTVRD